MEARILHSLHLMYAASSIIKHASRRERWCYLFIARTHTRRQDGRRGCAASRWRALISAHSIEHGGGIIVVIKTSTRGVAYGVARARGQRCRTCGCAYRAAAVTPRAGAFRGTCAAALPRRAASACLPAVALIVTPMDVRISGRLAATSSHYRVIAKLVMVMVFAAAADTMKEEFDEGRYVLFGGHVDNDAGEGVERNDDGVTNDEGAACELLKPNMAATEPHARINGEMSKQRIDAAGEEEQKLMSRSLSMAA